MNFLTRYSIANPTDLDTGNIITEQTTQDPVVQGLVEFFQNVQSRIKYVGFTWIFFVIFVTFLYSIMIGTSVSANTLTANWQDTTSTEISIEVGYDQDFPIMSANVTYARTDNIDLTILAQEYENDVLLGTGENLYNDLYVSSGSSLTYGFWRLYLTGCNDTQCTARAEFHPDASEIQNIFNRDLNFSGTLLITSPVDSTQSVELAINYQDSDALENVISANWQNSVATVLVQDVNYNQEFSVVSADITYTKTANDDLHFDYFEYENGLVVNEGDTWEAPDNYYLVGGVHVYGNWRIHKTGCGETQCTARADYYPNPASISEIFGQNKVVAQTLTISFAHDHLNSTEVSIEFHDADVNSYTMSANWQDTTETHISQEVDPDVEFPVLVADITYARTNNTDLHLTANEFLNDERVDTEDHTITPENYYVVGRQLLYGSWQVHKTGCTNTECTARAEFHPNVSRLQRLYNRKFKITESLIIRFAMNHSKYVEISVDYQDTEALAKSIVANWEGTMDTNIVQEIDYEEEFPVKSVNFVYPKSINNNLKVQAREFQNGVFVYMTEGEVTPNQNFINVGATVNGYWRVYLISCGEDDCRARADFHPNGDELKAIFNQGRTMTEKLLVRLQTDNSESIEVSITYQDSDGRGFAIDSNWQDTTDTHIRIDVDQNSNFPIVSADITYSKSNYGNGLRILAKEYHNTNLLRVGNHHDEQGLYYTSGTDFDYGFWRVYKTGCDEIVCKARADFHPDANGINQIVGFGNEVTASLKIAFNWHHSNSVEISLSYYKTDIIRFQWHNGDTDHWVVEEIGGYHSYPVISANLTYFNSTNNDLVVTSYEYENGSFKRHGHTTDQDGLYYLSGEGLLYGLWRVHKTGCNETECTARVDFHPNAEALEGLIGQDLEIREAITIKLSRNTNIYTNLSITYRDIHDIGYRWRKSSNGTIYAQGDNGSNSGIYEWQYLDLKVEGTSDISVAFSGHETIAGETTVVSGPEDYGTSLIIRQRFGDWHVSPASTCGVFTCYVIHYRPNRSQLNNNSHGLTIESALELRVTRDGNVIDTETITEKIYGLPKFDFSWADASSRYNNLQIDGTTAVLSTNSISQYDELIPGDLTYYHHKDFIIEFSAIEINGGDTITPVVGTVGNPISVGGGTTYETIGTNFQFGLLYYSSAIQGTADRDHVSGSRRLFFRIAEDELGEIAYENFATLSFVADIMHVNNPTTPVVSETVTLELRREPVDAQLNSGSDGETFFTIDENEDIDVTITLDPAPIGDTEVTLVASSVGAGSGFIGTFSENPVTIDSSGVANVSLSTNYVFSHDLNGQIEISVAESSAIESIGQPLSFNIANYTDPTISIESTAENDTINEGDDLVVNLIATPAPRSDLEIPVEIIEDGQVTDFLDQNFSGTVTIGTSGRAEIRLSTNVVKTHLIDGSATATISPGEDYLVDPDHGTQIIVIDNLVNSVVSIATHSNSITEGNHFTFTLTADPLPVKPFLVNFTVNETGDATGFLANVSLENPVEMPITGRLRGTVTTNLDAQLTENGEIQISLLEGKLYNSSVMADQIEVAVNKRENLNVPEVSIEYLGEGNSVIEGSNLRFRLTADPAPNDSILVEYEVSETGLGTGYYNSGFRPKQILIDPSGQVEFLVPTVFDNSNQKDGELTVTVLDSDSYLIPVDRFEAVVAVTNYPIPEISISSDFDDEIIIEGDSFSFTLTADPAPATPTPIDLIIVDQNGNHFRELSTPNPVVIGTSGTIDIKVYTDLVQTEFEHGQIEIYLGSSQHDNYSVNSEQISITTTIKDSVAPEVSIGLLLPNSEIFEGTGFTFELTATPIPLDDIVVNLNATDNGSGYFPGFPNSDRIIIDESGRAEVTINATNVISTSTDSGQITITILATNENSYRVSETANQLFIDILDSTPTVSITSSVNNKSVREGQSFFFTLTAFPMQPSAADPSVPEPIQVAFTGTDSGSGHLEQITELSPITINRFDSDNLSGSIEIAVTTNSITEHNLDGTIDIAIQNGSGYQMSTENNSISVAVKDTTTPVVSISSPLNQQIITEGDGLNFTLIATPAPEEPITVELSAVDSGDHLVNSYFILDPQTNELVETSQITIGTSGSEIIFMNTNINSSQVEHGQIEIAVIDRAESNYLVSKTENQISIKVKDSLDPVVSIASDSNGGFVEEGASFGFTLTANPHPIEPIDVILSAQDYGPQYIDGLSTNNPVTIGTNGSTDVTVRTRVITPEVKHGQIDIWIDNPNNPGFTVAKNLEDSLISVLVKDMVLPEVAISIQPSLENIVEGEDFVVTLTSNPAPVIPIQVLLSASDAGSGHFASLSSGSLVELPPSGSVDVTVSTNDVVERFENGEITILLTDNSNPSYTVGSQNSVSVAVFESSKPVVSISSQMNNRTIVEGDSFTFSIFAIPAPLTPIFVNLTASDQGSSHYAGLSLQDPIEVGTNGRTDVTVLTNNVTEIQQNGKINVTFDGSDQSDYVLTSNVDDTVIRVVVSDAALPVVSIRSESRDAVINEGDSFIFTVQSTPAPMLPIMVEIASNDNGSGHFAGFSVANPIEIGTNGETEVTASTNLISESIAHGQIEISIVEVISESYVVANEPSAKAFSVNIKDSVAPVISISSPQSTLGVTEGESFSVEFSAVPIPLTPLEVFFDVSDGGTEHFRDLSTSSPIIINQSGRVEIDVNTNVIAGAIEHGKVSIAVLESSDQSYTIGNNGQVHVGVADQVLPEVSISTLLDPQSVIEGEKFAIVLETNPHPLNFVDVTLHVDDSGLEYFQEFAVENPIRIGPNGLQEVEVRTNVIHTNLDNGQLSISISDENSESYTVSESYYSVSVEILNKMPEISISLREDITSVIEGSSFDVVLTAFPPPVSPLSVVVVAEDRGTGHLGELSTTNPVSIGTDGVASITVDSNLTSDEVSQGEIRLTILEGANYSVSEEENLVSVQVRDETQPLLPEISISTSRSSVQVGESAEFQFNVTPALDTNIRVDIGVTLSGNINLWRVPKYISVGNSETLSLNILRSSSLAETGSITVQILSSSDYVSYNNIAVVAIEPNQSPDTPEDARISVADAVVSSLLVTLLQDNQSDVEAESSAPEFPIVSISAVMDSINEGEIAQFQIIASAPVAGEIKLKVSQQGNFLRENPPMNVAMNGQRSVFLAFETSDDSVAELDGSIQVMILAGEDYAVSMSQNIAIVNVSDVVDRENYRNKVMTGLNAVLPQVTHSVTADTYQNTNDRLHFSLSDHGSFLRLGGENSFKDWLKVTGQLVNEQEMFTQMLLDNSSFAFDLSSGVMPNQSITAWGTSKFHDLSTAGIWSGELYSGNLGLDMNLIPNTILGVGLSTIEGNFDFNFSSEEQFNILSKSNTIYPYFGWKSLQGDSEFQATLGYGFGEVQVDQIDNDLENFASQHTSIAIGGKVNLAENLNSLESHGINLAAEGSVQYTQQKLVGQNIIIGDSETKTHQFDFGITGTKTLEFENGLIFSPYLSIGAHSEKISENVVRGMDYESGLKLDLPIGLSLASSGYLFQNQYNHIHHWHLNSSFEFDYNLDQQGFMLDVSSTFGGGDINQPVNIATQTSSFGIGDISDTNLNRVASEIGYVFELFDGHLNLNPYSRVELYHAGFERLSIGSRTSFGSNFNAEILGTRDYSSENTSQQFHLNGALTW